MTIAHIIHRRRGKSRHSLELIDAAHTILEEIQPASVRAVLICDGGQR